ncbi:MAG: glycosyltransferase [bacterium]
MKNKICFITTGDIKSIATAKRALGLANPLSDLGWDVSIVMEDTEENHHRVALECDERITVVYFSHGSALNEVAQKNKIIKRINPDYLYICAFVFRNVVGMMHSSKKIVEHSELQSSIPDIRGIKKLMCYMTEYYSIVYSDAILNASKYLQNTYLKREKKILSNIPMLYFPYAYNPSVINVVDVDYSNDKYVDFEGCNTFVFLGSVTKNYGVFTIIDAVKIAAQNNSFKVLILGKGRHYEEALRYVDDNNLGNYIYMPGFIEEEDVASYFSLATAFISPMNDTVQDWARCPSKLYMYLPYKKPIITCEIGEPYQIFKDDGYYYSPGNSSEMAKQIESVVSMGITKTSIDPLEHSWATRAKEFDKWIKNVKL